MYEILCEHSRIIHGWTKGIMEKRPETECTHEKQGEKRTRHMLHTEMSVSTSNDAYMQTEATLQKLCTIAGSKAVCVWVGQERNTAEPISRSNKAFGKFHIKSHVSEREVSWVCFFSGRLKRKSFLHRFIGYRRMVVLTVARVRARFDRNFTEWLYILHHANHVDHRCKPQQRVTFHWNLNLDTRIAQLLRILQSALSTSMNQPADHVWDTFWRLWMHTLYKN